MQWDGFTLCDQGKVHVNLLTALLRIHCLSLAWSTWQRAGPGPEAIVASWTEPSLAGGEVAPKGPGATIHYNEKKMFCYDLIFRWKL